MKRLGLVLLVAAFVLGLTVAAQAESFKLGVLSPLTGTYAQDGTDILNAVKLAVEHFGKLPGFDKIEILSEDSGSDGGKAVMAANKLINSKVNGVVGAYASGETIPASEPINKANIIQITPSSSNEKVTARGFKQLFRMCPRDDTQAWSATEILEKYLKVKTIAMIDDRSAYAAGLAKNIVADLAKNNLVKVVAHENIAQGDKDFTAVLTKIKGLNPDVVYMSLYQPEASMMIRQIKSLGITAKVMSEDAVYHPKYIEVGGKDTEGTLFTFSYAPESDYRKKFIDDFKSTYKATDVGTYAYFGYDCAMTILGAVKKAGSADTDKVAAAIRGGTWPGVTGDIKFDDVGDRKIAYALWETKGGKYVPVWDPLTGQPIK
ncbi:MAG: branched-chain amino acid ABC transporter substrate-binding protein [Deltaproteobacteria bacterium]|nr:branched-chain amino acid ABC transporter substrate-binding protein [Deltaproteobacteria bacterium]